MTKIITNDYSVIKERLYLSVISKDELESLKEPPVNAIHADLAVTCRILLGMKEVNGGIATESTPVTEALIERFGVSSERVKEDAARNSAEIFPGEIKTIESILGIPENTMGGPRLYVATNSLRYHGAAVMFYPGMMSAFARMLEGGYFILPSSKHEMILVPDSDMDDVDELISMVGSVNSQAVEPRDRLTDNAYHFAPDSGGGRFETAAEYKRRMKER